MLERVKVMKAKRWLQKHKNSGMCCKRRKPLAYSLLLVCSVPFVLEAFPQL